jgi:hypothetical protein
VNPSDPNHAAPTLFWLVAAVKQQFSRCACADSPIVGIGLVGAAAHFTRAGQPSDVDDTWG